MVRDNFAIFILAHGRPERLYTVKTLNSYGYTGKWYIILDDEDNTVDEYKRIFGEDHCIVFSKEEAAKKFDIMDNFEGRNVIVFARNMCNQIARNLGLKYFAEFEDDYLAFRHRQEENGVLKAFKTTDIDACCEAMLNFIDEVTPYQPNFRTIAWAQSGEMIGGVFGGVWKTKIKRKAMNTFFFKVPDDPKDDVPFIGRMNDDVNAYISDGSRGGLWFQVAWMNLLQVLTQQHTGGNTTAYKKFGTYVKSFYSVMLCPSSTRVAMMGSSSPRIHHVINWEYTVPKIINEKYKKK